MHPKSGDGGEEAFPSLFSIFYHNIKLIFLYATKSSEKMFSCSIESSLILFFFVAGKMMLKNHNSFTHRALWIHGVPEMIESRNEDKIYVRCWCFLMYFIILKALLEGWSFKKARKKSVKANTECYQREIFLCT